MKAADGTGDTQRLMLMEEAIDLTPLSWSPGGEMLTFDYLVIDQANWDVGLLTIDDQRGWVPLFDTSANEHSAVISPGGDLIAYQSDVSGRPEVYLERFPVLGGRQTVSVNGGIGPVWSRDGRELFFRDDAGGLLVAQVGPDGVVGVLETVIESPTRYLVGTDFQSRQYDVGPDGSFLFLSEEAPENSRSQIILVQNWFEELMRLVPIP